MSTTNRYNNIRSTTEQAITKSIFDEYQDSNVQTDQIISNGVKFRMTNSVSSQLPNPDSKECGQQESDNRIIGGTAAGLDEYPWLALLKYQNQNKVEFACSGVLINDEYILTAAHCVDPKIIKAKHLGKL